MKEIARTAFSRSFLSSAGETMTVSVTLPIRESGEFGDWKCETYFDGAGGLRMSTSMGVDSFAAIQNAIRGIYRVLKRSKDQFVWFDAGSGERIGKEHGDIGIDCPVPDLLGYEFVEKVRHFIMQANEEHTSKIEHKRAHSDMRSSAEIFEWGAKSIDSDEQMRALNVLTARRGDTERKLAHEYLSSQHPSNRAFAQEYLDMITQKDPIDELKLIEKY